MYGSIVDQSNIGTTSIDSGEKTIIEKDSKRYP